MKSNNKLKHLVVIGIILLIANCVLNNDDLNSSVPKQVDGDSEYFPRIAYGNVWNPNGTVISNAISSQKNAQMTSDGAGGAIITWEDDRSSDYDIYAQRINAAGSILWTTNGSVICNDSNNQADPQITSDGSGGAIITWEDSRNGNYNIYAQRINAAGSVQWTGNGTVISTDSSFQGNVQITSDGAGGAIITWEDDRSSDYDIYAQRINATGSVQWTENGIDVCGYSNDQLNPQLISDGSEGAIITWDDYRGDGVTSDIYIQRLNSNGDKQWGFVNGLPICTESNSQDSPQLISDGTGGAIITWEDSRIVSNNDIYAQIINGTGMEGWNSGGILICNASYSQSTPQLIGDSAGGALIAWEDGRTAYSDVYVQKINSDGEITWNTSAYAICTAPDHQRDIRLISDDSGGAIITWVDERNGNFDIYAQRLLNNLPESNTPADIVTLQSGLETIDWRLTDDHGPGNYRVIANNTQGNYYTWINWTSWTNNSIINIPINRSILGIFNYTIEYNDDQNANGISDMVIVAVSSIPQSNSPDDIMTTIDGTEKINWTLTDILGAGHYRVIVNNPDGEFYIWNNWTPWINNTEFSIALNRTSIGIFNYTLQFNNTCGILNQDTVYVAITEAPTVHDDLFITLTQESFSTSNFTLYFSLVNCSSDGIDSANFQVLWDGIDVSGNVNDLGDGNYRIVLNPIYIGSDDDPILLNMTVSIAGYTDTYYYLNISVFEPDYDRLFLEITKELFDEDIFKIYFRVSNYSNHDINTASFQAWWGSNNVSSNIAFHGNGNYSIHLDPIFLGPTDNAPLFNMTISVFGYTDLYYECEIANFYSNDLYIEYLFESYSEANFTVYFQVENSIGASIEGATIQAWWNGSDDLAEEFEYSEFAGVYYVVLEPIFVSNASDYSVVIMLNMTINAPGYNGLYLEKKISIEKSVDVVVTPCPPLNKDLLVIITQEFFSTENFTITFQILNSSGVRIENATIQVMWNGVNKSASVQDLGFGTYRIILNPIFINPGDDPITLSMTISATGYTDEYYELELSADIEEVDTPPPGGAISFGFYFLAIAFLSGIILIIIKKGKISRKTE